MATQTEKKQVETKKPQTEKKMFDFVFGRENYILMVAGIVILGIGYLLLAGGRSDDPNVFNGEQLFSTRRLVIAPLVILAGLIVEIVAILKKSK